MKKIFSFILLLQLFFSSTSSSLHAVETTPHSLGKTSQFVYLLITTVGLTAYNTLLDANGRNPDVSQWELDYVTAFNLLWRSGVYAYINYLDETSLNSKVAGGNQETIKQWRARATLLGSFAGLITYNCKWTDNVLNIHNYQVSFLTDYINSNAATQLSYLGLFTRNILWYLTVPARLKPANYFIEEHLYLPIQAADGAFVLGQNISPRVAIVLAHSAYILTYLLRTNLVISVKTVLFGLLPSPSDMSFLRFPNCGYCFFGTNFLGRNQEYMQKPYELRNEAGKAIREQCHILATTLLHNNSLSDDHADADEL